MRRVFSSVMVAVMAVSAGQAMTLRNKSMICPYDGTSFTATLQGSGTTFDNGLDCKDEGASMSP